MGDGRGGFSAEDVVVVSFYVIGAQGRTDPYDLNVADVRFGGAEGDPLATVPEDFELKQNYPNPFYPETTIARLKHRGNGEIRPVYYFLEDDESLFRLNGTSPPIHKFNEVLLQEALTITPDIAANSEAKTPLITALELVEPQSYLLGVDTTTQVSATIDWRQSTGARVVDFTYDGETTSVPAVANTATFDFNPGDPGQTITAIASPDDPLPSNEFVIEAPTVAIPGWGGVPSDWSA